MNDITTMRRESGLSWPRSTILVLLYRVDRAGCDHKWPVRLRVFVEWLIWHASGRLVMSWPQRRRLVEAVIRHTYRLRA